MKKKKRSDVKEGYQQKFEKEFLKKKRQLGDAFETEAWARLQEKYGRKISQEELLSLARVVANELDLELSREYKRRKELLIIWFQENLSIVWPFIEKHIAIYTSDGDAISAPQNAAQKINDDND